MNDIEFSTERLLEQASGNQSGMFIVSLAWAKQRDGSVDGWAGFVGDQFADSWDEMRDQGALDIARIAGLNFACSADSELIRVDGDAQRAEAVIQGPDPEWLERWLDGQIKFDGEWEKKVVERILHNMSLLFERTFSSVQELNRYRKEIVARLALKPA